MLRYLLVERKERDAIDEGGVCYKTILFNAVAILPDLDCIIWKKWLALDAQSK